jgi:hypothetical protein
MELMAVISAVILSLAGGVCRKGLLLSKRKLFRLDYLNSIFQYRILHLAYGIYGIPESVTIKNILLK